MKNSTTRSLFTRKDGVNLFPEVAGVILDRDNCFREIFDAIKTVPGHWQRIAPMLERGEVNAYAIFEWRRRFGDAPGLLEGVIASGDAWIMLEWRRHFGDAPGLVEGVIASGRAYAMLEWREKFGDAPS